LYKKVLTFKIQDNHPVRWMVSAWLMLADADLLLLVREKHR
jgi:hypothetical protein